MARTTISLNDDLYQVALGYGERDKRDFSNLCSVALEEFLRARGELPADDAVRAELLATAREIGLPEALKLLRKRLRRAA